MASSLAGTASNDVITTLLITSSSLSSAASMTTSSSAASSLSVAIATATTTTTTSQFQKAMPYVYTFVGFVGMATNLLVMVVIATSAALKKRLENGLIFNQSLIDALSGLFMILNFTTIETHAYYTGTWGDFVCRFWVPATPVWSTLQASIFSLVVITVERYLEVVFPIAYKARRGVKVVWIMVLTPWILAVAVSIHVIVLKNGVSSTGNCIPGTAWPSNAAMMANGYFNIWLKFLLPLPVFIYCYTHMFVVIRRSALAASRRRKDAKVVTSSSAASAGLPAMERARRNIIKTLLYVMIAHIVCLAPNTVIFTAASVFGVYINRSEAPYVISVIIVYVQCCINPIIYTTCYAAFKREVGKRLCPAREFGKLSTKIRPTVPCQADAAAAAAAATADACL